MTEAVRIMLQSWEELISNTNRRVFVPKCERDVQCYLYHLCIKNGLDARNIHADMRYGSEPSERLYTDLVAGSRRPSRLYVELKWIKVTKDVSISNRRLRRMRSDIDKCNGMDSSRNPVLLVFLCQGDRSPLLMDDLTPEQIARMRRLQVGLSNERVKVRFSV